MISRCPELFKSAWACTKCMSHPTSCNHDTDVFRACSGLVFGNEHDTTAIVSKLTEEDSLGEFIYHLPPRWSSISVLRLAFSQILLVTMLFWDWIRESQSFRTFGPSKTADVVCVQNCLGLWQKWLVDWIDYWIKNGIETERNIKRKEKEGKTDWPCGDRA